MSGKSFQNDSSEKSKEKSSSTDSFEKTSLKDPIETQKALELACKLLVVAGFKPTKTY
jgi:hypothetical protein